MTVHDSSDKPEDGPNGNDTEEGGAALAASSFDSLMKGDLTKLGGEDNKENKPEDRAIIQPPESQTVESGHSLLPSTAPNHPPQPAGSGSSSVFHPSSVITTSARKITHSSKRCLARWPRTVAVVGKIFLLWTLILWALCFGFVISRLEGPSEVAVNNQILQQRWFFTTLPFREVFVAVINLPTACMEKFIEENTMQDVSLTAVNGSSSNVSGALIGLPTTNIDNNTIVLVEDIVEKHLADLTFPLVPTTPTTYSIEEFLEDLHEYLEKCEEFGRELMKFVINRLSMVAEDDLGISADTLTVGNSLTFNWNRCWDNSILGNPNPWSPTQAQINASANQDAFFREQWTASQQMLFRNYSIERGCFDIPDNVTRDECLLEATTDSVLNADGGAQCATNTGAAGWFWFTVMTTVGYGNQSPVTEGGRALVGAFGWLSIIAFGGIIIYSSANWTAIVDDLFHRVNMNWLSRPAFAAPLWGVMSALWIVRIAARARTFWSERVVDYEVTQGDSMWFAYISTLTVGLGDFYLQPEGMFVSDVFNWASLMLTGFVVVSTCLGKVGDLIASVFPSQSESFGDYLKRTDGFTGKVAKLPESKTLELLKEVAQQEEATREDAQRKDVYDSSVMALDEKTFHEQQLAIVVQKRELLIQLLETTQAELDQCLSKSSDIRRAFEAMDLKQQEEIMDANLQRTKNIRAELETMQMEHGNGTEEKAAS